KVGAGYLAVGDFRKAVDFLTRATTAKGKPVPADWLLLALAHVRLAENDQARKACAKAAELLKPKGADATVRPLVREILLALGTDSPETKALLDAAGELDREAEGPK